MSSQHLCFLCSVIYFPMNSKWHFDDHHPLWCLWFLNETLLFLPPFPYASIDTPLLLLLFLFRILQLQLPAWKLLPKNNLKFQFFLPTQVKSKHLHNSLNSDWWNTWKMSKVVNVNFCYNIDNECKMMEFFIINFSHQLNHINSSGVFSNKNTHTKAIKLHSKKFEVILKKKRNLTNKSF